MNALGKPIFHSLSPYQQYGDDDNNPHLPSKVVAMIRDEWEWQMRPCKKTTHPPPVLSSHEYNSPNQNEAEGAFKTQLPCFPALGNVQLPGGNCLRRWQRSSGPTSPSPTWPPPPPPPLHTPTPLGSERVDTVAAQQENGYLIGPNPSTWTTGPAPKLCLNAAMCSYPMSGLRPLVLVCICTKDDKKTMYVQCFVH